MKMKGLSEIIGFFLILVILIAVLIPAAFYILSSPTQQYLTYEQTEPLSFDSSLQKEIVGVYPLDHNKPIELLYTGSSFYVINTGNASVTLPTLTFTQIYLYNGITYTPLLTHPVTLNLSDLSVSDVPIFGNVESWSMNVPIGESLIAVTSLGNVFVIPYVVYQASGLSSLPIINSLQQVVSIAGIPRSGNFPITAGDHACWDYLRGIITPDPYALVPIDYTVEIFNITTWWNGCYIATTKPIGSMTFQYGITDTILEINPPNKYQWINLTFLPTPSVELNSNISKSIAPFVIVSNGPVFLGCIYIPAYIGNNNGYIYYPMGVGLSSVVQLVCGQPVAPTKTYVNPICEGATFSYYGHLPFNINKYGGTSYDYLCFTPIFFQVDINLSNFTVYYYVQYSFACYTSPWALSNNLWHGKWRYTTNIYGNTVLDLVINGWYYIGKTTFTGYTLYNNSPLYIVIPQGVYLLNVSMA